MEAELTELCRKIMVLHFMAFVSIERDSYLLKLTGKLTNTFHFSGVVRGTWTRDLQTLLKAMLWEVRYYGTEETWDLVKKMVADSPYNSLLETQDPHAHSLLFQNSSIKVEERDEPWKLLPRESGLHIQYNVTTKKAGLLRVKDVVCVDVDPDVFYRLQHLPG